MTIQIKGYTPKNNLPGEDMTPEHLTLCKFVGWNCWCGNEEHCMVCNQTMITCKTYEVVMVWRASESEPKLRTEYLRTVCSDCLAALKKQYIDSSTVQFPIDDKIMVSTLQGELYYSNRVSQAVVDLEQHHPKCQPPVFNIDITAIQEVDGELRENYVHTIVHPANEIKYLWQKQPINLWPRKVDSYGIYDNHYHTFYPPEKDKRLLPEVPIIKIIATLTYIGISFKQIASDPESESESQIRGRTRNVLAKSEVQWAQSGPYRKIQYFIDIDRRGQWTLDIHLHEPCDYSLTRYRNSSRADVRRTGMSFEEPSPMAIQEPWLEHVLSGEKDVEGRIGKGGDSSEWREGQIIRVGPTKNPEDERGRFRVEKTLHFEDLETYLRETWRRAAPHCKTLEEAREAYLAIRGPKPDPETGELVKTQIFSPERVAAGGGMVALVFARI